MPQPPPSARWYLVAATGVVVVSGMLILRSCSDDRTAPETAAVKSTADLDLFTELSRASQRIAERVGPTVVRINVERHLDAAVDENLQLLIGRNWQLPATDQGSAVVVAADGHLLTNYHVVHAAKRIMATIDSRGQLEASLVGVDALTDLALLKVAAQDLPVIDWSERDEHQVGEFVWAIGSPYGLQRSLSFGVLSATDQQGGTGDSQFHGFLQTDAAINPGNSGGPLVDSRGRAIGINTAILGQSYQGVGFAIPSQVAREVCRNLRELGRVRRGWLGVVLDEVPPDPAQRAGLRAGEGVLVSGYSAKPGVTSPAKSAGILPGDIIVSWDGTPVSNPRSLGRLVAESKLDQVVKLGVMRDGKLQLIDIVVGERP